MTNRSGCYAVAVIMVSAILFPADARSQTLARSFQELQGIARQGDSILVTDGAGRRVRAKIEELTPSTLTVLDENGLRRALPEDDVRVIERGRSLRKPVLIGLGLGAAVGFGAAAVLTRSCENECGLVPFWMGGLAALGAGIGAGTGLGVGLARRPATIYRQAAQSRVTVSPFWSKQAKAIIVSTRF
jgi:hypothetical protein